MKKIYFLVLALGLFTSLNAQIVTIPDANFKARLLFANANNTTAVDVNGYFTKIDLNNNGNIEVSEALNIQTLRLDNANITNLTGIQSFANLKFLYCNNNQLTGINVSGLHFLQDLNCNNNSPLTSLLASGCSSLLELNLTNPLLSEINVSNCSALITLNCYSLQLTSLIVSGCTSLFNFNCANNHLTSLDSSGLTSLTNFYCSGNQLTSLNVSGCTSLNNMSCNDNMLPSLEIDSLPNFYMLHCYNNQLTSLVLSNLPNFKELTCYSNELTTLNLSGLPKLDNLYCAFNNIASLDISQNHDLRFLYAGDNPLQYLNLKNGSQLSEFSIAMVSSIQYVCVDEFERSTINSYINGNNNSEVNSYCTFNPGDIFYTIQGNNKLDSDLNGCNLSDTVYSNLKFNITNGTMTDNIISNASGNYSIPVESGTHVLTPILEDPSYFTIFPSSFTVSFPAQTSPITQNFCITPNGSKQDLEVVLLPLTPSRPGFDTKFKIIYKNKGTVTQSGSVVMDYFDHVTDFVSSVPTLSNESGNLLTWDFINLQPFETREINFTVNINNPMETPAVNIGDVISFEAYVYPLAGDLTTGNNHSGIRQVVVGSFDPNDKTCLEGNTITPDKVGEYVHYMIRFENTGTFPAENIVVKDMIDTDKFDVSSLVPIKGSHSFVTNITNGNKVEFIFENINLPFDDANNDGFVAFKIKTKPTLVLGNTFSNTASIYFDYNFPIVTNTATTTIAALSVQDFEFSNYFSVYPNPVHDVLNISSNGDIEVSSINIYNTLGQLVLVIPNAKDSKTVDVSSLASGNYFIKINSDKGASNTKFVKK